MHIGTHPPEVGSYSNKSKRTFTIMSSAYVCCPRLWEFTSSITNMLSVSFGVRGEGTCSICFYTKKTCSMWCIITRNDAKHQKYVISTKISNTHVNMEIYKVTQSHLNIQ